MTKRRFRRLSRKLRRAYKDMTLHDFFNLFHPMKKTKLDGLEVWIIGSVAGDMVTAMASLKIGDRRYKGSVDINTNILKASQAAELTESLLHDIRNELIGDIKEEFCSINKQLNEYNSKPTHSDHSD